MKGIPKWNWHLKKNALWGYSSDEYNDLKVWFEACHHLDRCTNAPKNFSTIVFAHQSNISTVKKVNGVLVILWATLKNCWANSDADTKCCPLEWRMGLRQRFSRTKIHTLSVTVQRDTFHFGIMEGKNTHKRRRFSSLTLLLERQDTSIPQCTKA